MTRSNTPRLRLAGVLIAALSLGAGCTGEVTEPGEQPGVAGGGKNTNALCVAGPAPLRRLTRTEYNNTVRDLLGDTSNPADAFPQDENLSGFAAGASVSPLLAELYMTVAEDVAATAKGKLDALMPCDPSSGSETACVREFIEDFGKRAFRRPLADSEVEDLLALYSSERKLENVDAAVELVIAAVLQSPSFLYRPELGDVSGDGSGKQVRLNGYEMASRLSYFLWQTMPDEELFALADQDGLGDPDVVAEQARRMLDDERSKDGIISFFGQWFRLGELSTVGKSDAEYPEYTQQLGTMMGQETRLFVEELMWNGDARLGTLLTANWTYLNGPLADIYGVQGVTGDLFKRVTVDADKRSGILTHPSLMAVLSSPDQSSPVYRGAFVREALLCQHLSPPPDNLQVAPPDLDPNLTTRERYTQHMTDPACKGCHAMTDPIGFGFEHYDAIGRYREKDSGFPVDASGELVSTLDIDGPFDGAIELGVKLAQSSEVRQCVARQWFRFGLGRLDSPDDACALEDVYSAFDAADGDMRELVVAIVRTPSFRFRPALGQGGSQ